MKRHQTPSLKQERARELFSGRSKEAAALMRQGYSKREAWALIVPSSAKRYKHKKRA